MRKRVLVVAEEMNLRAAIARMLRPAGYTAELAAGEKRARELISAHYGEIVAAIVAPDSLSAPGLALAQELQDATGRLIVVANRAADVGRLARALPEADSFLVQPLNERELLGCLVPETEADVAEQQRAILRFEGRTLDPPGRVFLDANGRDVPLTRAEFELLHVFARNPGRVLSRDQLRQAVAGRGADAYDRSIDMLVARLRRKIEPDPKSPRFIVTVPGAGYKFVVRMQPMEAAPGLAAGPRSDRAQAERLPAERRQLTVLSGQIVGLAALSSRLDPEDLREVIATVRSACVDVLARFQGVLAKFQGDTLLGYFGYPEAHEDDAERAVRSGLQLVRALHDVRVPNGKLQLRLGVATGLVVIGDLAGGGTAGEYVAVGEPVNLALHLQSAAAPDAVVVASDTRDLVRDFFDYDEIEPVALDDGIAPLPAWRVTGESAAPGRFEALHPAALPELVGRAEEIELLLRRWSQARGKLGQVVLLTGEAGIGKSRLVLEFESRMSGEPHAVLEYFGLPRHTDAPLFPLIGELERASGFASADGPKERRAKLDRLLELFLYPRKRPRTTTLP